MSNRLSAATSPYLLQHRDNPVDWYEWGEEAFEQARRRDVPELLGVGSAMTAHGHRFRASCITLVYRSGASATCRVS